MSAKPYQLTLENISNSQIKKIIDPKLPFCFIPGYNPNPIVTWQKINIDIENNKPLENVEFRNMYLDLLIDTSKLIKELDNILKNQLSIFQFSQTPPSSLLLENISPNRHWDILVQNGCQHHIWIDYELVTITTTDKIFYEKIKNIQSIRRD